MPLYYRHVCYALYYTFIGIYLCPHVLTHLPVLPSNVLPCSSHLTRHLTASCYYCATLVPSHYGSQHVLPSFILYLKIVNPWHFVHTVRFCFILLCGMYVFGLFGSSCYLFILSPLYTGPAHHFITYPSAPWLDSTPNIYYSTLIPNL